MMKFDVLDCECGLYLLESNSKWLFVIGDDISIKKKGVSGSFINETSFNYEGMKNVLIGKTSSNEYGYFTPKHIVVIQMK